MKTKYDRAKQRRGVGGSRQVGVRRAPARAISEQVRHRGATSLVPAQVFAVRSSQARSREAQRLLMLQLARGEDDTCQTCLCKDPICLRPLYSALPCYPLLNPVRKRQRRKAKYAVYRRYIVGKS